MKDTWSRGVVAGFDGSPDSLQALRWAANAAERHGGELTVATAYTAPYGLTGSYFAETDVREILLGQAHVAIDSLQIPSSVAIKVRAESGSPVHILVTYSRSADLVVVGRSHRTGLERFVLGPVSSPTAAMAHGPVAVVPVDAATTAPHRVIACVDPDDDPAPVLDFAFDEGRAAGRPVAILHAVEPARPVDAIAAELGTLGVRPRTEEEMAELLELWSNKYTDVDRTISIRRGWASTALLENVSHDDLLVLGGRRRPRVVGRLLGSVADAVLRHAPCAVVVVHSPKEM